MEMLKSNASLHVERVSTLSFIVAVVRERYFMAELKLILGP